MAGLAREHDLHKRRQSRNIGTGIVLVAFVGLLFGLTMVKVKFLDPEIMQQEVRQ